MRFLVFDTETTGLPTTKFITPTTLHLWPHIVQFSSLIYDTSLNAIVDTKNYIVTIPDDMVISESSTAIHGITTDMSIHSGNNIDDIIASFISDIKTVDKIIGHNVAFDLNMIKVALMRKIHCEATSEKKKKALKCNLHYLSNYEHVACTMNDTTAYCNIKMVNKYNKEYIKSPKLIELHNILFNSEPNNLHNSFNDILVTLRCFMKYHYNNDLVHTCGSFVRESTGIFAT